MLIAYTYILSSTGPTTEDKTTAMILTMMDEYDENAKHPAFIEA